MKDFPASQSEDNGIAALTDKDLAVYSVGISTGGVAEIRMAKLNPDRHIIATTIDPEGMAFAKTRIKEAGFETQIEAKLEDIIKPLPYPDNHFDYIYARLVLHYLTEQELQKSLLELRRALKPAGKIFIVVRSTNCPDAKLADATTDPLTMLTTVRIMSPEGKMRDVKRYFHTPESIKGHVSAAGFTVEYAKAYDEQLYADFMRTLIPKHTDNVIELLAHK